MVEVPPLRARTGQQLRPQHGGLGDGARPLGEIGCNLARIAIVPNGTIVMGEPPVVSIAAAGWSIPVR